MLTLNMNYEVLPDRLITIKLPETVRIGPHELVIVLEESDEAKNGTITDPKMLMQFAGSIAAFNEVDGVEYQRRIRSEWN